MDKHYNFCRGPDWDTEVDGKSCTVKELLVELYEKVNAPFCVNGFMMFEKFESQGP